MDIIFFSDMIALFSMGIAFGILKKRGKLTEKIFAITTTVFWCYFFLSIVYSSSPHVIVKEIVATLVILVFWWGIGYQIARWIYREWMAPK